MCTDQTNYTVSLNSQLEKCSTNRNALLELLAPLSLAPDKIPPVAHAVGETEQKENPQSGIRDHKNGRLLAQMVDSCGDADSGFESESISSSVCSSTRNSPEMDAIPTFTFNSIQDSLQWVTQGRDPNLGENSECVNGVELPANLEGAELVQVLCTGSLHLIGGVIGLTTQESGREDYTVKTATD